MSPIQCFDCITLWKITIIPKPDGISINFHLYWNTIILLMNNTVKYGEYPFFFKYCSIKSVYNQLSIKN